MNYTKLRFKIIPTYDETLINILYKRIFKNF